VDVNRRIIQSYRCSRGSVVSALPVWFRLRRLRASKTNFKKPQNRGAADAATLTLARHVLFLQIIFVINRLEYKARRKILAPMPWLPHLQPRIGAVERTLGGLILQR
jgi:hypothetical protein